MKKLPARLVVLFVVTFFGLIGALPAVASASSLGPSPVTPAIYPAAASTTNVVPMVIWSLVAVAIFALIFGTLYLLKRRVGGFPAHPTWTAPISVMPSSEFPDEGTFGETPPPDTHH